jgi:hypothetical protein
VSGKNDCGRREGGRDRCGVCGVDTENEGGRGGGGEGEREKGRQGEWRVWGRDLERARKARIRARRRWVEMEDGGRKENAKEEWKEMRREMKRLVRKKRVSDTLERVQRIERLGRKEPKRMWQAWKKWGEKEKN